MDYDFEDTDALSVEAQVARNMGDADADELAEEPASWRFGGRKAQSFEADKLTFDKPNTERSN